MGVTFPCEVANRSFNVILAFLLLVLLPLPQQLILMMVFREYQETDCSKEEEQRVCVQVGKLDVGFNIAIALPFQHLGIVPYYGYNGIL